MTYLEKKRAYQREWRKKHPGYNREWMEEYRRENGCMPNTMAAVILERLLNEEWTTDNEKQAIKVAIRKLSRHVSKRLSQA